MHFLKKLSTVFTQKQQGTPVNWMQFGKTIRNRGCCLLKRLDDFEDSVLVTGCQRSGTTLLSRIITNSEGMANYWFGRDDELDAALILSGSVAHNPKGRYCFQTTYLNQCYHEYYDKSGGHKIIWVLRNPYSVILSMMHNWRSYGLNELFDSCGAMLLSEREKKIYSRYGRLGINKLKRACLAYNGKVSQVFQLKEKLAPDTIKIIEYDDLINNHDVILPLIYHYIDLPYKPTYANSINSKSISKANNQSNRTRAIIGEMCMPVYKKASSMKDIST